MTEHPMDKIPVRNLRFAVADTADERILWSHSSPEFAMFINALGVHVPYFERFLIKVMRAYRDELQDEPLYNDVQAIIGQEAHHALNFVKWTERMRQRYPDLTRVEERARQGFDDTFERKGKRFRIGFTAGYETFTFLGGMIILDRFYELMGEAEPNIRALWVWHQVEEVEHGAVAFDFYKAFYGEHEWYRRWMVLYAFCHIAKETLLAFRTMVNVERSSLRGRLKAWRFFWGFAKDLFVASLPVYSRSYHPRNHPICNDEQNQIAIAWRKYEAAGNNALELSDKSINAMLSA